MSNQDRHRRALRPCRRCGKMCHSSASQRIGICGPCHRFLREAGMNPKILAYVLSKEGPIDWGSMP